MAAPVDGLTTDVATLASEAMRRSGPFFWDRGIGRYSRDEVTVVFEQLRTERRSGETTAEATFWVALPTGTKQIHRTRLNLLSTRSQSEVSRYLTERHPGKAKDEWQDLLEDATRRVTAAYREGSPMVPLARYEGQEEQRAEVILPGVNGGALVTASDATILFGDGGSGKSMLALSLALSIHSGRPLVAGLVPARTLRVAYLDWEWNPQPHVKRLRRLWGSGDLPPDFMYRRCMDDGPLPMQIESLLRQVVQHRIQFLVIDSVALAVDGDPQEASDVTRFFQALGRLKCGSILLAHKTKDVDATQYPFGCHSEDTEILTGRGWVRHRDWIPGEAVMAFDPERNRFEYQVPSHLHIHDYEGPMYHVASPATDMLVTPNHRMCVKPVWARRAPWRDRWEAVEVQDLPGGMFVVPYANPMAPSPDAEVVGGDDFLRVLGWWIAEGHLSDGAPGLTQAPGPLADAMQAGLSALGIDFWERTGQWDNRPGNGPICYLRGRGREAHRLGAWLRTHCGEGAAGKHLPDLCWRLSQRQKLVLLEALVDGDGTRRPNDRLAYCTVSRQLADDVMRLAIECGRSACMRPRPLSAKGRHQPYEVDIGPPRRSTLTLRRHRHLSQEPYSGKVYCFTVPGDAYLTRRNGKMAVGRNSVFWHNSARVTWYVQGSEGQEGGFTVGLYNRKANDGFRGRAFGLRIDIDPEQGWTRVLSSRMDAVPELADNLPAKERIANALRLHGPQLTHREIRDLTGMDYKTIANVCQREAMFLVDGSTKPARVALQEEMFAAQPTPTEAPQPPEDRRVLPGPWTPPEGSGNLPLPPLDPELQEELKRVERAVRDAAGGRPPCPGCGASSVTAKEDGLHCFRCDRLREDSLEPDPEPDPGPAS